MSVIQQFYKKDILARGGGEEIAESYSKLVASGIKNDVEQSYEDQLKIFQATVANGMDNHEQFMEYIKGGAKDLIASYENIFHKLVESNLLETLKEKHSRELNLDVKNGVLGYKINSYPMLEYRLNGISNGIHIFAADPNVGKTAILTSLGVDLLKSNKNVNILFYTIDDEMDDVLNRFLAICSGKPINVVRQKRKIADMEAVDKGYVEMFGFAHENRLHIYDSQSFKNAKQLCNHVNSVRGKFKDIVVFVDGPTNLSVEGRNLEERGTNMAIMLHELWKGTETQSGFPLIISNELKKRDSSNSKPKKSDIKGSTKWEYVAKSIFLMYADNENDFNEKKNMNVIFNLDKNKFSHHKGAMAMEFKPERSMFVDSEWN